MRKQLKEFDVNSITDRRNYEDVLWKFISKNKNKFKIPGFDFNVEGHSGALAFSLAGKNTSDVCTFYVAPMYSGNPNFTITVQLPDGSNEFSAKAPIKWTGDVVKDVAQWFKFVRANVPKLSKKYDTNLSESKLSEGTKIYKANEITDKVWYTLKTDLQDQINELVKVGQDYGVFQNAKYTAATLKKIKKLVDGLS